MDDVTSREMNSLDSKYCCINSSSSGMCCASLEEPKTLMKMGLSMVLIGHMNFLLGALVHGVVLRHINFHKQARAMEYAISNVGIVVGILAILLSKNKKSKGLTSSLLTVGVVASLTAAASAIGLLVSMVRAILHDGRSLLTHCRFPDTIGYSSITNDTTLILWVPLIVTCVIQMVFSALLCCLRLIPGFTLLPEQEGEEGLWQIAQEKVRQREAGNQSWQRAKSTGAAPTSGERNHGEVQLLEGSDTIGSPKAEVRKLLCKWFKLHSHPKVRSYMLKAHFSFCSSFPRDVTLRAMMNSRKSIVPSALVSNVRKTCSANFEAS
ncbi:hypothetical protein F7725_024774, partial [Dissostichus mawsoni]